jgi:hypothetical protein
MTRFTAVIEEFGLSHSRRHCSRMKHLGLIAATVGSIVFCLAASNAAEPKKKPAIVRTTVPSQMPLLAIRKMLIERKKASREHLKAALALYEDMEKKQNTDYEINKGLYSSNLISRSELDNSERALSNTRLEIEQIRNWITEDDLALSLVEEAADRELIQLPSLPLGGYEETATLIRYNGPTNWSLAGVQKIIAFYRARFGRALPISAMGQSPTHDRMSLDHRNALDIAVQPASTEGRELMAYLRKAGIPFIAFRGQVRSTSTGAHIHIGRPSPRIIEVKQRSMRAPVNDKSAVHG